MKEKTVLITGATSGIGKEIALQLAQQNAQLIIGSRDLKRGEETADWIEKQTGNTRPDVLLVDTSSHASIRQFSNVVKKRYSGLDVLINNAGINQPVRQLSADGIESTFATNVLGYFWLTNELIDLLKASGPARVVNVASTFAGEFDLNDLEFKNRPYDNIKAYKQSKQANRMLSWALARRLNNTQVTVNAMSPGLVWTGLYREMRGGSRTFMRVASVLFGRSVAQGADTATWLASGPNIEGMTNRFWVKRNEKSCTFRDETLEEKLWEKCENYVR